MRGGAKLAIRKGIELLHLAFSLQMVEMQRMAHQSLLLDVKANVKL